MDEPRTTVEGPGERLPRVGADTPPRAGADAPPIPPKPQEKPKREQRIPTAALENRLKQMFASIGLTVGLAFGDEVCSTIITKNAPSLAKAYDKLARESPAVRQMLEWLLTGSSLTEALVVTGATIVPILQHHNRLPARLAPLGEQPEPEPDETPTVTDNDKPQKKP